MEYKNALKRISPNLKQISVLHTHGFCTITQPGKSQFKRLVTIQGFGQLDMLTRYRSTFRATMLHSVLRNVYANADHYTTFSDQMKNTATQLYKIDTNKITIVPHGV